MVGQVKKKNLARSVDERSKNLFYKVVGRKGARREILAPLLSGEYMDKEGLVLREKRMTDRGVREVSGSNLEPLARVRIPFSKKQESAAAGSFGTMPGSSNQYQGQGQHGAVVEEGEEEVGEKVKDITERFESNLIVQRSSWGGHLGSQVSTSGSI